MARLSIATVLVAFAWLGHAQTTTIDVPQGSGQFPTIGQVNCLEDEGSGRYCAATYECDGGSGELWGDMANHNGRRAISATSPVANGRGCEITVDGKAAVQWFTGYRPAGRTGELVGLTTSADALRPVVRGGGSTGGQTSDGSLLQYLLDRFDFSIAEEIEAGCVQWREGNDQHTECLRSGVDPYAASALVPNTELLQCTLSVMEEHRRADGLVGEALARAVVQDAFGLAGSNGVNVYTMCRSGDHLGCRGDPSPCRQMLLDIMESQGFDIVWEEHVDVRNPGDYWYWRLRE